MRPLAVSLPGGPGPRDHCRALGEQPALCRALGTPRRVRSSDDRLRVPKLTLHLVGMSRRGLRRRRARQPGRPGSARPLLGGRAAGSLLSDQGESGFHGPVALCSASSRTCAGDHRRPPSTLTASGRSQDGSLPGRRRRSGEGKAGLVVLVERRHLNPPAARSQMPRAMVMPMAPRCQSQRRIEK